MGGFEVNKGILKLQRLLLIIVLAFLFIDIGIGIVYPELDQNIILIALILLILAAPIRIIAVAEYFRKKGNRKYQYLSYMVIVIIGLTALYKAIL